MTSNRDLEEHLLMVPVTGLVEVFHVVDKPVDIPATLRQRGGKGEFIALGLTIEDVDHGTVMWYADSTGPINPRAREALTMLTDIHMIFTGPVAFAGVAPERVFQIVSALSRKE